MNEKNVGKKWAITQKRNIIYLKVNFDNENINDYI